MATCERSVAAAAEVATWKSQLLPEFGLQPLELSHETEHQLPFFPIGEAHVRLMFRAARALRFSWELARPGSYSLPAKLPGAHRGARGVLRLPGLARLH